jgi:hypothetical protein
MTNLSASLPHPDIRLNPSYAIANALLEGGVPLLRCVGGRKTPCKRPEPGPFGEWDVITDPDGLDGWLRPGDNLAMLLGESKSSPVIAVGLDVYKDEKIIHFATAMGVTAKANVWAQRTGRGGYTVCYFYNGPALKRDCVQQGSAIDLLVNGYTLIAPSDTSKEPQGGGPYKWLPGKSPLDIPLAEMDTPPKDLLVWWQSLDAPKLPEVQQATEQGYSPGWITGPIPDGQRNSTLTKIAGYYHRKLSDDSLVRHLVHQANQYQCCPPLSACEVDTILDSILPREGASHYRGVWPAKLEVVS